MINKDEVFVGCGMGQHENPAVFKPGCNACLSATINHLVDLVNENLPEEKPKKPKNETDVDHTNMCQCGHPKLLHSSRSGVCFAEVGNSNSCLCDRFRQR